MINNTDVPELLKYQVGEKIAAYIEVAEIAFNRNFHHPTVLYDIRGGIAGTAQSETNTLRLNPVILMNNQGSFLTQVVPHELAHLIADAVYPSGHSDGKVTKRIPHHGSAWKTVMNVFGVPAHRTHRYKIPSTALATKLGMCESIYVVNRSSPRAALLCQFIDCVKISSAHASTYYTILRNKYDR